MCFLSVALGRLSASDTGAVAVAFTCAARVTDGRAHRGRPRAADIAGAGPWEETRQKNGRAWSGARRLTSAVELTAGVAVLPLIAEELAL
ncbi:hypothetical protein SVIO_084150 [Streptomyces violaceusniger]|uniref:Uncharacterized protein n=1 Tax=Streptomyces violaceusniger TaxID=68280 RepID=A0A4D4L9A5_STRVO|nr:hypothetical protein SVIO_084150 [Streptomyces violaceusniger]